MTGVQTCALPILDWFAYWRGFCRDWLLALGIKEDEMRLRDHSKEELCFYSKGTTDIEFLFPFGWGELWGIADRTDYDLTQHQNTSGQDMSYFDDEKKEKYIPYVIEPSLGADRVTLAFLCAAYDEENIGTEEKPDMRTVLHFHPALAPVKIGVLPLSKKLNEGAEKVFAQLSKKYNCEFDDRADGGVGGAIVTGDVILVIGPGGDRDNVKVLVEHGIDQALRHHPQAPDVAVIEHPGILPLIAVLDFLGQAVIVLHGEMQVEDVVLFRLVTDRKSVV